jgi:hypothetical protein
MSLKYNIIGHGSEAFVFGPFTYTTLLHLNFIDMSELLRSKKYILKVYKDSYITNKNFKKNEKMYANIRKCVQHDSVIFPLKIVTIKGQLLNVYFNFPDNIYDEDYYKVELQIYGGAEFNDFLIVKPHIVRITMKQFIEIWNSILDILEDVYSILEKFNCVITDVKPNNMVISLISRKYKVRLVDMQITSINYNKTRIITPDILKMPVQYFNNVWWNLNKNKEKIIKGVLHEYKKRSIRKYLSDPEINYILSFIHGGKGNLDEWIKKYSSGKLTKEQMKTQRIFFVVYPLFNSIISLVLEKTVRDDTNDPKLRFIISKCLLTLVSRGNNIQNFSKFINSLRI